MYTIQYNNIFPIETLSLIFEKPSWNDLFYSFKYCRKYAISASRSICPESGLLSEKASKFERPSRGRPQESQDVNRRQEDA